jgi:transposase
VKILAAQEHESKHVEPLLDSVAIGGKRGRPRTRSRYVVGDKGYSSKAVRASIKKRGATPIIAKRSNETTEYYFDKELYRNRNVIERQIGWLKESRSIGTRYEKKALNFLGLVILGCIQYYLKLLEPVF